MERAPGRRSGHDPVTWAKVRQALGFIASAIRFRLADAADLAWRPTDVVLRSRTVSSLFVGGPVIVVLFAVVRHNGRFGLVADIQDPGELGVILYAVIRTGRWWRDVKPPEPKARRARSDGGNGWPRGGAGGLRRDGPLFQGGPRGERNAALPYGLKYGHRGHGQVTERRQLRTSRVPPSAAPRLLFGKARPFVPRGEGKPL